MTTDPQPISWTGAEVAEATGGRLVCGSPQQRFTGIAIDSRTIATGELFVAVRGEVHDGHAFVDAAVAQGAAGVIVEAGRIADRPVDDWRQKGIFCIAAEDTVQALGRLAAFNRHRVPLSVAAVTGSNGKTSTREMMTAVLQRRFPTLATRGNFNNEIGLPLTLFRLSADHRWAVLEMGMNHPGEIARLTAICRPDVGVITNVAPAHLEGLGSIEGVAAAKGELVAGLPQGAVAVLNGDDPLVRAMAERTANRVCFFGCGPHCDIRADDVEAGAAGTDFVLKLPGQALRVTLNTPGTFMVPNALAAAAVGHLAGVGPEDIRAALESFTPVKGRLNVLHLAGGIHLIDDTYNANPASMTAAFDTVAALARGGRVVLVTGDMRELGAHAERLHGDVGRAAAAIAPTRLYVAGEHADMVAAAARGAGLPPQSVVTGDKDSLVQDLKRFLMPGDWVLVKGSRGMRMETVVQALVAWRATTPPAA